jgi:hypothetical protein
VPNTDGNHLLDQDSHDVCLSRPILVPQRALPVRHDAPGPPFVASSCTGGRAGRGSRAPEDLGLVVVARPRTLPDEVGVLPHGLGDPVDPGDVPAVRQTLERVQLEVERRRQAGGAGDADLVVVIREVGDLAPEALEILAGIAASVPE